MSNQLNWYLRLWVAISDNKWSENIDINIGIRVK